MVLALEQQYDAFERAEESGHSLLAEDQPLPTGEEIGAAVRAVPGRPRRPDADQPDPDRPEPARGSPRARLRRRARRAARPRGPRPRPVPRPPARHRRGSASSAARSRRRRCSRGPHRRPGVRPRTRCTPTSCGPATRRCRSSTTSSGSATAARSRTRRVVARQHGRAIYYMTANFQRAEEGFEHQDAMPEVIAARGGHRPRRDLPRRGGGAAPRSGSGSGPRSTSATSATPARA